MFFSFSPLVTGLLKSERFLEFTPLLLEDFHHFADRDIGVRAIDQMRHQVFLVFLRRSAQADQLSPGRIIIDQCD